VIYEKGLRAVKLAAVRGGASLPAGRVKAVKAVENCLLFVENEDL